MHGISLRIWPPIRLRIRDLIGGAIAALQRACNSSRLVARGRLAREIQRSLNRHSQRIPSIAGADPKITVRTKCERIGLPVMMVNLSQFGAHVDGWKNRLARRE